MGEVSELIRSERLALIDLLETLTPGEWATPSLCSAWTVQDVAAHLAWAPALPMPRATVELVRSGFRINAMIADSAVRWSGRGTAAILDQLRTNAADGAKPFGMPEESALADAVAHALDIRRPLDRPRPIPQEAFAHAAHFFVGPSSRWPLSVVVGGGARERIDGLHLGADDLDWSYGQGQEVHGSAEALMLLLTGRVVEPDEFSGPGSAQLRARLRAP